MPHKNLLRTKVWLLALALVASACATPDVATETTLSAGMSDSEEMAEGEEMQEEDGHSEDFTFGDPMAASGEARVIEVTASDDFKFDPSSITIEEGETITFRVTNVGVISHEFILGGAEMQEEHEAEMAEMAGQSMTDEPNAIEVEPGDTKEMTWHMTQTGEIIFGCHQPGHYAAGMKGTITVG